MLSALRSDAAPSGPVSLTSNPVLIVGGFFAIQETRRSASANGPTRPRSAAVVELAELLVKDAAEWRTWLHEHHTNVPGVWLVLHKKGGRVTSLTYGQALDEALCFGWIDGQISQRDAQSYSQRFTPRRPASTWSARNVEHVARLTKAGQMQAAGLAAVDAAKTDGRWQAAYQGQANASIPKDLSDALAANPAAASTFDQLDSANRYSIIYRLNAVKRPQTRARKLDEYIDMLNSGDSIHSRKDRRKNP
jgi:uncharacterized protein YdeI (YjbR/CyaY-like superfamily)